MLTNYFKIALRNLHKQKLYAFINVFGLAVGLAFCTLIFLFVRDELSFDRFHAQRDRIYRVYKTYYEPDGSVDRQSAWLPMPQGPAMKADLAGVDEYVRLRTRSHYVRAGDKTIAEDVLFADASFFDVFTFPLVIGNPSTALADPAGVVLSQSAARKYFGEEDPLGRRLAVRMEDRFEELVVSGVAKDPPDNSGIRFGVLAPFKRLEMVERSAVDNWDDSSYLTYVRLAEGTSAAAIERELVAFREKHFPGVVDRMRAEGFWTGDGLPLRYHLQPLKDIHFNTTVSAESRGSDPAHSYILGSIALLVLVVASINFMTLAVGRSAGRAREIGIRKVMGAVRTQLMFQFWGEALVLSLLAFVGGLVLTGLFLPVFNDLSGKTMHLDLVLHGGALLGLAALVFMTALLAGSYPALVLSGLRPIESLKNRLKIGGSKGVIRPLVVLQFALSSFLIVSTTIMLGQLRYIQSKDLGFDTEQVVVIPVQGLDGERVLRIFREELAGRPDVASVTGINNAFAHGEYRRGFNYRGEEKAVYVYRGETNFIDVLGMELVAGRNFDPARATDSLEAVIINEAMARDFGWTDPVGEVVTGLFSREEGRDPTVIGVVRDFNFVSLHEPVEPMMLSLGLDGIYSLLVRLRPGEGSASLDALRSVWERIADVPFTYSFLDEDLDRQYRSEQRWSRIVGYGSFFALLVACMGLFGLAALSVAGRTKEIGIRKVLGASASSVVRLVSKEFAWLVVVGVALAAVPSYVVMQRWLNDFAYAIEIGPGVFAIAGALVLAASLLTVSYQTARAASADPVKSLRYE